MAPLSGVIVRLETARRGFARLAGDGISIDPLRRVLAPCYARVIPGAPRGPRR